MGSVTEATSKWANVLFHDGIYSVDSHTSYTMQMPCHAFMHYSGPSHSQLVPEFLRPQATIPKPPTPPQDARALGVSRHGHLFALQVQHYLEKKSLIEWGCHDASQALTRPLAPGLEGVWLYAEGKRTTGKRDTEKKKKKPRATSPARKKGNGGTGTTKPGKKNKKKRKNQSAKNTPRQPSQEGLGTGETRAQHTRPHRTPEPETAGGKRGAHETTHVPKAGRNRKPTTNTTNSRH